jgi:hypothetical protein
VPGFRLSVIVEPKDILLVDVEGKWSGVGDGWGLCGRVGVLPMDRLCREDMRNSMVVVGLVVRI